MATAKVSVMMEVFIRVNLNTEKNMERALIYGKTVTNMMVNLLREILKVMANIIIPVETFIKATG